MARRIWLRTIGSVLLVTGSIVASAACGSGVAPCDQSKCLPGNQCIAYAGEVRCRKVCTSNTDPATNCPFNYTCQDQQTGGPAFCVQDLATGPNGKPLDQKPSGQWGATCGANKGIDNPDCDGAQGFKCYGQSPTDAKAYCTRYDCTRDAECGAGFWCAQINVTPNASQASRTSVGQVQAVCLRRTYCATCVVDLDCPDIEGTHQHCVKDDNGAPFCAPECVGPGTCHVEAKCIPITDGAKTSICYPRAKTCVGDGSLCAPCRVDTDCGADGACIQGDYTTEKSCAKKMQSCKACPSSIKTPARDIGCLTTATQTLPANYCMGLYSIDGTPSDFGCYSPDR
jgi:hypothetical protein